MARCNYSGVYEKMYLWWCSEEEVFMVTHMSR